MESMNNNDQFEAFLKQQNFSEKAPEAMLRRLEARAAWNRPWWKTTTGFIALMLAILVLFALVLASRSVEQNVNTPAITHELPALPEQKDQQLPVVVAAGKSPDDALSSMNRIRIESADHFNLVFIDRPVKVGNARREYADLI